MVGDILSYEAETFMEDPEERFKESIRKFNSDNGTMMVAASDDLNEVGEDDRI